MDKAEIVKIKRYCDRATPGPWKRSLVREKTVSVNTDQPPHKWRNIVCFNSGSHIQDWYNFQFISKARQDLPRLTKACVELMHLLELTNRQLELEKANKKLEIGLARLHLRRINEKKLKLKGENRQLASDKQKLELEKRQKDLQIQMSEKQIQLERTIKNIELERTAKQLEIERAQKLELFDRDSGYFRGECDKFLDELDRVEASFKGKEEEIRLSEGWTENDLNVKARKMIVPRDEPETTPEEEQRYEERILEMARQLRANYEQPVSEPAPEYAPVVENTEINSSIEENTMNLEPIQPEEAQKKLGLEDAQKAVGEYINEGEDACMSLDSMLDELDKTEAALNQWTSDNAESYGRFGENVASAAQAASEFIRPAENLEEVAQSEPQQAPPAEEQHSEPFESSDQTQTA